VFEEDRLLERATVIGEQIRHRLSQIAARSDVVPMANVRGLGAMIGFDLVKDATTGEPDGAAAKVVTARALERGLIILSCGAQGETIRILVPLTISDATLQEGLLMLEQALSASPDR
jgi:4-aminobutyrate aminotransferase/(S)-3-amino-2-methylpropionate transaminase